jgi:hypothetical protein
MVQLWSSGGCGGDGIRGLPSKVTFTKLPLPGEEKICSLQISQEANFVPEKFGVLFFKKKLCVFFVFFSVCKIQSQKNLVGFFQVP